MRQISTRAKTNLRITLDTTALYGLYGLFHRGMPGYLFLRTPFVFFDFDEPLIFFFLDYLAIMGLFVWIGHYLAKGVGKLGKRCNSRRGVEG